MAERRPRRPSEPVTSNGLIYAIAGNKLYTLLPTRDRKTAATLRPRRGSARSAAPTRCTAIEAEEHAINPPFSTRAGTTDSGDGGNAIPAARYLTQPKPPEWRRAVTQFNPRKRRSRTAALRPRSNSLRRSPNRATRSACRRSFADCGKMRAGFCEAWASPRQAIDIAPRRCRRTRGGAICNENEVVER